MHQYAYFGLHFSNNLEMIETLAQKSLKTALKLNINFMFKFVLRVKVLVEHIFLACLGLIHTRHFRAQYCDIEIKRYYDKKIISSHMFK